MDDSGCRIFNKKNRKTFCSEKGSTLLMCLFPTKKKILPDFSEIHDRILSNSCPKLEQKKGKTAPVDPNRYRKNIWAPGKKIDRSARNDTP